MILYAKTISPRLRYITEFIGKELLGEPFILTTNSEEFGQYTGAKINYTDLPVTAGEFWISPHALLFESGISHKVISCFESNNHKAFFETAGDFAFDIFAATFYLLSRYEEYLPHKKDVYGRYAHENSLAYREKFLQLPLINKWLSGFKKKLDEKFSSLIKYRPFKFEFLPTYDIDEAFAYKHKVWWRTTGGFAKALLKRDFVEFKERIKVIKGSMIDPYDSFAWMDQLHEQYHLEPLYFFLLAEKTGRFDKNIFPGQNAMQDLIKRTADKYEIGVHPSWQSGDDNSLIRNEISNLDRISGKKIDSSRQHYIRLCLPATYRCLLEAGIRNDFSMGYGSINGFRASVASPFYWYDLEREAATSLLLHPFCFMEANSHFEQRFTPQQALEELRHYYREVKSINGKMITIWHNTFLGGRKLFTGWREIYEEFVRELKLDSR